EAEKRDLLAGALATLFTIDWEEPFGLVMIESMACGTPVLATRRGSVPEVVEDGVTGFVADDYRDLAAFVDRAAALDPREIRGRAAARFSPGRPVEEHVAAYRLALELGPAAGRRRQGRPRGRGGRLLRLSPAARFYARASAASRNVAPETRSSFRRRA